MFTSWAISNGSEHFHLRIHAKTRHPKTLCEKSVGKGARKEKCCEGGSARQNKYANKLNNESLLAYTELMFLRVRSHRLERPRERGRPRRRWLCPCAASPSRRSRWPRPTSSHGRRVCRPRHAWRWRRPRRWLTCRWKSNVSVKNRAPSRRWFGLVWRR